MTLKMLGEEYLRGEQKIRLRIRDLRLTLSALQGDERKEMEARIRSLYEMALSARQTGLYLIDYYMGAAPGRREFGTIKSAVSDSYERVV